MLLFDKLTPNIHVEEKHINEVFNNLTKKIENYWKDLTSNKKEEDYFGNYINSVFLTMKIQMILVMMKMMILIRNITYL